jgi:RimJ/RimL family protein N-acetyltransferase
VPFRLDHAGTYLTWMQDPHIREMTASEELQMTSLDEAEAFCRSVEEDPNNCTFLVCDKTDPSNVKLVGDINFFLSTDENSNEITAEVNIMIGEASARRKGLAQEALGLGVRYVVEKLHVTVLLARISDDNVASMNMFQTKLQWPVESHSEVFSETTFKMSVSPKFLEDLVLNVPEYSVTDDYESNKVA